MDETVMLPRQVRGVSLRAESFDADANTVEVVFTTGAAVLRSSWFDGDYVETLDVTPKAVRLGRLNAGAPFLNTHSSYDLSDIIGSVVPGSARIEGGKGVATIKLSGAAADADTTGKIRDGVIRNVSVGYIVHQVIRTEAKDGASATARVTDWEPIEISAVPIPADPGAQVRSEPAGEKTPCLVTRAMPAPAADPATEARVAETARVQGILKVVRQLGLSADLADKAIADGITLDAFRSLAIDARAAAPVTPPSERSAGTNSTPTPAAAVAASHGEPAMSDRANDTNTPADQTADAARNAAAAGVPPQAAVDIVAVRAQERQRIADIRLVARKLKLSDAVADKAIDEGISIETFRAAAIDAVSGSKDDGQFTISVPASDPGQHRTYAEARSAREKGTDATRAIIALAACRGVRRDAADFVSRVYGRDGEVLARALGTSVGSAGGFLVPPEMSAEVIELLRPASVIMASGPRILPMPSGNLMIPRITAGATAGYVGENQPTLGSQPQFGMVQLSAKKLTTVVPISNDMIRFPAVSTDAIVRDDMVRSIAIRADLAFIRGTGSQFSPRGLKSFAGAPSLGGANVLTAAYVVGSAYASGGQAQAIAALTSVTTDLGRLELALMNANIPMSNPGWLMAPRTAQYLMNIRDGQGNQVYYAEMAQGRLRGKPFRITTQIPTNMAAVGTDGTAPTTDGTEIYLADFAEVFIGEAYGLELDVFPGGSYVDSSGNTVSGVSNDQTVMRAIVQHDMAMRQEAAVAVLTGARWF